MNKYGLAGNPLFTRREFLKLGSASFLGMLAATYVKPLSVAAQPAAMPSMGRIVSNVVDMHPSPSLESKVIKTLWKDIVLPITNVAVGTGEPVHNRIWYELNHEGYVHSGSVQPVTILLNQPLESIPENGALAEISVPFTDACWNPRFPKLTAYRLYYETTQWITAVKKDDQGSVWYEILEDFYQFRYYVNAAHLRTITSDEVSPLSPSVPGREKKLEVHLNDQTVIAYEYGKPVQMFRCAAGITRWNESLTPVGKFTTDYKRPSRHMINGSHAAANTYDLPGVPWVSFIDENGISFHGTYWHNDFGRPRSHGCINLPSSAAKWVYRWTTPSVPYGDQKVFKREGTLVEITD
jgi:lipoprotein-anchoring transpeptidase ErfK/SrfK